MIESHSSPEIKTASLLHRFHHKKTRIAQLEKRIEETRNSIRACPNRLDQAFLHLLSKHLHVARAMKEVLYSEIIKYSPQR